MRKTLNINLGGMAFIIDENAFDVLHTYLEALKRKFSNEAERQEILNDIEARIAEMLNQKLASNREVVSIEDVQSIIETMGRPEDIAGDEPASETSSTSSSSTSSSSSATQEAAVKKRLFRDPDDAKIGGVIAGLCHYFGITDPVWARVAALVLIPLTSGSIILLYLLLLIVIPKALTAAEKLQMKGEPVNINTIEKEIKDAAGRASESVHKIMKDENFFEKLWDIFASLVKALIKVLAVFDIVIAMCCLVAIVICFVTFYLLGASAYSAVSHLLINSALTFTLFSYGFLLFFATPLIALIYLGLKILLGQRSRVRWLKSALLIFWAIGLALLGVSAGKILVNFKVAGLVNRTTALMKPAQENLYVQITDPTGRKVKRDEDDDEIPSDLRIDEDGVFINGINFKDIDLVPIGKPTLQLMPSENDSFYIQEVITSQGKNNPAAVKNAEMVIYSFSQTDSLLNLQRDFYIGKEAKWRHQEMKVRIAIPEGKKIRFADNIDIWHAVVKGDGSYDDTYFANTVWTVERGKVTCIEGENHFNAVDDKPEKTGRKLNKHEEKEDKIEKESEDNEKPAKDKNDKDGDF